MDGPKAVEASVSRPPTEVARRPASLVPRVPVTAKIAIPFAIVTALLVASVGAMAYGATRDQGRDLVMQQLDALAGEKASATVEWLAERRADLAFFAADPEFAAAVAAAAAAGSGSTGDSYLQRWAAQLVASHPEFATLSVVDRLSGRILASTRASDVLAADGDSEFQTEGQEPDDTFSELEVAAALERPFLDEGDVASLVLAVPVAEDASDGSEASEAPGALVARLSLQPMQEILLRNRPDLETFDSYLAAPSGRFATEPRRGEVAGNVRSSVAATCATGGSGSVDTTDDRGVRALVAYHWIEQAGLCVVTKADLKEVLTVSGTVATSTLVATAFTMLLGSLLVLVLSRRLLHPIVDLRDSVRSFSSGELDVRVPVASNDEFGDLAAEFNRMAEALAAERSLLTQRVERFFRLSSELLATLAPDGTIREANPAWAVVLGIQQRELIGRRLTELVEAGGRAAVEDSLSLVRERGTGVDVRVQMTAGDSVRWIAWNITGDPEHGELYAAGRDVTDAEEHTRALAEQTDALERSNAELAQFAYVASHDLQEPLRMVSSYVQLLGRRYEGKLDSDADEFIGYATEGAARMRRLIEDLLAYSRVGTHGRAPKPVELDSVVDEVLGSLQIALEESGGAVTVGGLPGPVMADRGQLVQVYQNLIANAIKFRGETQPEISVGGEVDGHEVLLWVRDNGIGFDESFAERIFLVFQRLHTRDEYPGTGIGLALCRKVVERHGGRMWVESATGRGSTFFFTLPMAESSVAAETADRSDRTERREDRRDPDGRGSGRDPGTERDRAAEDRLRRLL